MRHYMNFWLLLVVIGTVLDFGTSVQAEEKGEQTEVKRMRLDPDAGQEEYRRLRDSGRCILIDHVYEGTPADWAGFEQGDIIVRVNGERVTSNRDLVYELSQRRLVSLVFINVRTGELEQARIRPRNGKLGIESSIVRVLGLNRGKAGALSFKQELVEEELEEEPTPGSN